MRGSTQDRVENVNRVVVAVEHRAVGVAWALGAAVRAAPYFVLSDRASTDEDGLHPLTGAHRQTDVALTSLMWRAQTRVGDTAIAVTIDAVEHAAVNGFA
jgi:hypothetical protein